MLVTTYERRFKGFVGSTTTTTTGTTGRPCIATIPRVRFSSHAEHVALCRGGGIWLSWQQGGNVDNFTRQLFHFHVKLWMNYYLHHFINSPDDVITPVFTCSFGCLSVGPIDIGGWSYRWTPCLPVRSSVSLRPSVCPSVLGFPRKPVI